MDYFESVQELTEEFMSFALFALDHATDSIIPYGGPLVPFALTEVDGMKNLTRFPGDLQEGQTNARRAVKDSKDATRVAVAWDGFLTSGDIKTEAVFVEAYEIGSDESVILAQRYGPVSSLDQSVQTIGNPAVAAKGSPLV
jgi:hypothetical protein